MIRRINLFGSAGCGKSVTAAGIFHELKKENYNIEYVSEWIKNWAYQKYELKSYDQFYVFTKQLRQEDLLLNNGVNLIVTDSPLLLNVSYSKQYNSDYWKQCLDISSQFEEKYPSLNIYLERGNIMYQQEGRYEDLAKAVEFDIFLKDFLSLYTYMDYTTIKTENFDQILQTVRNRVTV